MADTTDTNNRERDIPMKEGPTDPVTPDWLKPYEKRMPDVRGALIRPDQTYFDYLWRRATGILKPALSMREREVLFGYFKGEHHGDT